MDSSISNALILSAKMEALDAVINNASMKRINMDIRIYLFIASSLPISMSLPTNNAETTAIIAAGGAGLPKVPETSK